MSQDVPHINTVIEPVNAYIEHTKLADRDFSHAFGELIGSFVTALDRLREKSYLVYDVRDQLQANIEDYGRILSEKATADTIRTMDSTSGQDEASSEVKLEIFPVAEKNEKLAGSSSSQQDELIASLNAKIAELTNEMREKDKTIAVEKAAVNDKSRFVQELCEELTKKERRLNELLATVQDRDATIRDLNDSIVELRASYDREATNPDQDKSGDNEPDVEEEEEEEEVEEEDEMTEDIEPDVEDEDEPEDQDEEEEEEPEVEDEDEPEVEEEPEVEDEEEPEVEEEEEEEEVMEFEYKGKRYYIEDEKSGPVYECLADDSVGKEIGKIINGVIMVKGPSIGKKSVWVKL